MEDDARRLADAFGGGKALEGLSDKPADMDAAYRVQRAVVGALGRPIVGYKLAQTTKVAQEPAGLTEATVAPLLDGMIVETGTDFGDGAFFKPEIEAEIAIEMREGLEPNARADDVRAAAAGVRIAIEVADTRYVDKPAVGVRSVVADMNSCGALVIGPLMGIETLDALRAADASATLGDGTTVPALGPDGRPDPLNVVAFLTAFLDRTGERVPAGAIITTGTHTAPTRSGPGEVAATFGDVGRVTAMIGRLRS